jgi:hypothetical protein
VVKDPAFFHHLAKGAVERWFAFEMAHQLDAILEPVHWAALVECGGTRTLGNVDVVLIPREFLLAGTVLRVQPSPWPLDAVAVELKVAHLAHGKRAYTHALLADLDAKPKLASQAGRRFSMFFGVQITTDGAFPGTPNAALSADRWARVAARRLKLAEGLTHVGDALVVEGQYGGWNGHVAVEVIARADPATAPAR